MTLEGDLRVRLILEPGRIQRAEIASTRPDVAQRLLRGRRRAEAQAAVPLLFSLCGRSQATAASLACAAAAGEVPTALQLGLARRAVAAEILREVTWLALLQWPQRLGERPSEDAVSAARLSLALPPGAQAVQAIALAAFGMPAAQWLRLNRPHELRAWAQAGATATARYIANEMAAVDAGTLQQQVLLLPARLDQAELVALAQSLDQQADFAQQPHWRGQPAETGALARQQHEPLLRAWTAQDPSRVVARLLARLHELALLLQDAYTVTLGTLSTGPGSGLAWVENARGLLLHRAVLDGRAQQLLDYRIVAPTEWNFHPGGPLLAALAQAPAADDDVARRLATRLVHSLDPCVACHIEVVHA